jgi:hypothetical protein
MHDLPPGMGSEQPCAGAIVNSEAFSPVNATDEITRSDLPLFATVTARGFETPPALIDPKLREDGFTEIFGASAALTKAGNQTMQRPAASAAMDNRVL